MAHSLGVSVRTLYRWGAGLFADVKGLQQQQAESPRRYVNFGPKQIKGYHSSIAVHGGDAWKKRLLIWNINPRTACKRHLDAVLNDHPGQQIYSNLIRAFDRLQPGRFDSSARVGSSAGGRGGLASVSAPATISTT